jgi:hypothetical protein
MDLGRTPKEIASKTTLSSNAAAPGYDRGVQNGGRNSPESPERFRHE